MLFHFIAIISEFKQDRVFAPLNPLFFEIELRVKWLFRKMRQRRTPAVPVKLQHSLHHVKHMTCCQSAVSIDTCRSIRAVPDRSREAPVSSSG
jgi:hypothetical protein